MSFAVQRIDHVEVFVRDIAQAAAWYDRVLGLKELARWDPEPVMIGADDTKLALFLARPDERVLFRSDAGDWLRYHRVAWRTDRAGFEAAQQHLRSQGVAFQGPVDHRRMLSIYFDDPDGHRLEITCDA